MCLHEVLLVFIRSLTTDPLINAGRTSLLTCRFGLKVNLLKPVRTLALDLMGPHEGLVLLVLPVFRSQVETGHVVEGGDRHSDEQHRPIREGTFLLPPLLSDKSWELRAVVFQGRGIQDPAEIIFEMSKEERKDFYRSVALGLNRPLFAVYRRVLRMYDNRNHVGK